MTKKITTLTAISFAAALTLAACGGGGGGSSGSSSSNSSSGSSGTSTTTSPTVTGTQSTPQFAANSAQLAAFNLLNQSRQQCGFAEFQENTVLDNAAQNHAKWEGANNTVSDSEQSGQTGFTGGDYQARATYAGFPSSVFVTGASGAGNPVFPASFVPATAGQQFVADVLSGVYHVIVAGYPANIIGFGEYETQTTSGAYTYTNSWQSMSFASTQAQTISNAPLTFPCSGATGLPYKVVSESPTPPNVSASGWGQAQAVFGNSTTDTIVLQTATLTDSSGNVTTLQILNSTTDPSKLIPTWEAVAYPTSPLTQNTTYTTTLTGTINGTPFSRTWSWSTGSYVS
ncbi:CAP domain-containing protein [Paraburkholderia sp. JHI869]|uniref:CAP domain-containing protein n=1 Tax=Paraburkholderia sp. JHI869 TaxID=3112959 RepID=UPI003176767C